MIASCKCKEVLCVQFCLEYQEEIFISISHEKLLVQSLLSQLLPSFFNGWFAIGNWVVLKRIVSSKRKPQPIVFLEQTWKFWSVLWAGDKNARKYYSQIRVATGKNTGFTATVSSSQLSFWFSTAPKQRASNKAPHLWLPKEDYDSSHTVSPRVDYRTKKPELEHWTTS